jgi:hypothetical protein
MAYYRCYCPLWDPKPLEIKYIKGKPTVALALY